MATGVSDSGGPGSKESQKRAASEALKTYRYLRIAMVLLLAGIGVAVAVEWWHNGAECLQGSISAYYYTPVRAFFVSAVLALGVCMVAIRGIGAEEVALNLAGLFAPVVALVPTPTIGDCTSDSALKAAGTDAVNNNMTALFWLAPLCVLYILALRWVARRHGKDVSVPPTPGLVLPVAALWAVALYLFFKDPDHAWFIENGHDVAAILMFVCIVLVVFLNGLSFARKEIEQHQSTGRRAYANRYMVIAVAMVVLFFAFLGYRAIFGWEHWVFAVEAALLLLFLAFWTLQTEELWDEVVREGDPQAAGTAVRRPAV